MTSRTQHGDRRGGIMATAAVAAALAIVGAVFLFLGMRGSPGPTEPHLDSAGAAATASPTPSAANTPAAPGSGSSDSAKSPGAGRLGPVLSASDPVALDIAAIGVKSNNLVSLGLAKDGTIEVPTDFAQPGWYEPGPTPGELGPAVISGHLDNKKGPAVFYRLGELKPGEKIKVGRKDGSVATFAIDKVARYAKDKFPTRLVYGTTSRAEIRLVTCGGAFDRATGHYVDNIVVFGHLAV